MSPPAVACIQSCPTVGRQRLSYNKTPSSFYSEVTAAACAAGKTISKSLPHAETGRESFITRASARIGASRAQHDARASDFRSKTRTICIRGGRRRLLMIRPTTRRRRRLSNDQSRRRGALRSSRLGRRRRLPLSAVAIK